jgi:hypothetical protein
MSDLLCITGCFTSALPQTQLGSEDGDDIANKLFNSLLIFAGLLTAGGFEVPDDQGFVLLVQNVLGRCLERDELANEFFLQLIRQTTDHPEPNGRINVQNWRFVALTVSIMAPSNKVLLDSCASTCFILRQTRIFDLLAYSACSP